MRYNISVFSAVALLTALLLFSPGQARAHCDTMNGPVVKAAQKALETGDVSHALAWVQKKDEKEVRALFEKTRKVRTLGNDAKELADHYFFENLVRIHRAGEGEPFTGLKSGDDVDPGIAAADKAIERGSVDELTKHMADAMRAELTKSFTRVMDAKKTESKSVEAGREYVAAYVHYMHQVETIHKAVTPEKNNGVAVESMHKH